MAPAVSHVGGDSRRRAQGDGLRRFAHDDHFLVGHHHHVVELGEPDLATNILIMTAIPVFTLRLTKPFLRTTPQDEKSDTIRL